MSKLIVAGLCAVAALGLAGCKGAEETNVATENLEEFNATEDLNMDMNADVNMDMNATENATGNETGNEAANSY